MDGAEPAEPAAAGRPARVSGLPPGETWIIVFGAAVAPDGGPSPALAARADAAASLARAEPAAMLLLSGGVGRHGPAESALLRGLLLGHGVAQARLVEEPTARDTVENARAAAALLRGRAGRVLAVSHGFHLPRCLMLLRLAGLAAARGAAAADAAPLGRRVVSHLREAAALPWDALVMLAARMRGGTH